MPRRRSIFGACPGCGGFDWLPGVVPIACRCGYREPARFTGNSEPRWPFPYNDLGPSALVERMKADRNA